MFDAATAPVAAVQPDPHRAVPQRVGQVLGLVHTLIAYGKNLADRLRKPAEDPHVLPCFAFLATTFGTGDLALILARITRGLLRAAALEARLRRRAARGRDLKPTPVRLPRTRKTPAAEPAAPPRQPAQSPSRSRQPTTEEILAKDRRRPIGAVLVGICLDLGIAPGQMGGATWGELRRDILLYGGSLATLLRGPQGKPRSDSPSLCELGLRSRPRPGEGGHKAADPTDASLSPSPSFHPIPIAGPTVAFTAPPAPSPQSLVPACTGPP